MSMADKKRAWRVEPPAAPPVQFGPIPCPCCHRLVKTPPLEIVIDRYGVSPMQGRVLAAVWRGRGMPVNTERIFDAMYADDADGGPSYEKMYRTFKHALLRLRRKLRGSGVSIEAVGYRQGYRITMRPARQMSLASDHLRR